MFSPLLPFIVWIGISLINVAVNIEDRLEASAASYFRLLFTVLFGLLLYLSIRKPRELKTVNCLLLSGSGVVILIAVWEALSQYGLLGSRYGSVVGFNSLRIISGLLVIYAFLKARDGSPKVQWIAFLMAGLVGPVLAKSISSTLATGISLMVGLFLAGSSHEAVRRFSRTRLAKAIVGSVFVISLTALGMWSLRQADLIGLFTLEGGSLAQRLMIAYAGLLIFLEHPLFGAGWQVTSIEAFIGDPALNWVLMERFPNLPTHYFFIDNPTSLHNLYV